MKTPVQTSLRERVEELNNLILKGEILSAFDRFYAEDVKMQENDNDPTIGKSACRINEEAFVNNITEFRGASVENVIVSDNITVVEWDFDFTHSDWGERTYRQVAVQRWNDEGLIIDEKFYYNS